MMGPVPIRLAITHVQKKDQARPGRNWKKSSFWWGDNCSCRGNFDTPFNTNHDTNSHSIRAICFPHTTTNSRSLNRPVPGLAACYFAAPTPTPTYTAAGLAVCSVLLASLCWIPISTYTPRSNYHSLPLPPQHQLTSMVCTLVA